MFNVWVFVQLNPVFQDKKHKAKNFKIKYLIFHKIHRIILNNIFRPLEVVKLRMLKNVKLFRCLKQNVNFVRIIIITL